MALTDENDGGMVMPVAPMYGVTDDVISLASMFPELLFELL